MAKANKTTTKSVQKSTFFSRLVPRTPKSKLIVFLVVFALIGGGVMAYRSFAATGFGIYTGDQLTSGSKAFREVETGGAKRGYTVIRLTNGGRTTIAGNWEPTIWAPYVRACANIRSSNNYQIYNTVGLRIGGRDIGGSSYTQSVGRNYTKVCSNLVRHSNPSLRVNGYVQNNDGAANTIVGSISIEYADGGGK